MAKKKRLNRRTTEDLAGELGERGHKFETGEMKRDHKTKSYLETQFSSIPFLDHSCYDRGLEKRSLELLSC